MKIFNKQTKIFLSDLKPLNIASFIVAFIVIIPIFNFLIEGIDFILGGSFSLGIAGRKEIFGTLKLLILVSFFGGGLGTLNGWFGKLSISNNIFVGHFRFGLICSIASFFCGSLYFFHILIKYWSNHTNFLYLPIIKNIFAQVFITGLLAPLLCTLLFRLFQTSKGRYKLINFINK